MSIHLHGNVQINFGVIWHFLLSYFLSSRPMPIDNQKCWNLAVKLRPIIIQGIVSSC